MDESNEIYENDFPVYKKDPDFKPETDDETPENSPERQLTPERTTEGVTITGEDGQTAQTSALKQEPERRFVDDRWLCLDFQGNFLEYIDNEWYPVEGENVEDLKKKWDDAPPPPKPEAYKCEVDGKKYVWCPSTNQWIPDVDVDEDFLAAYQANYGVEYDYASMPAPKKEEPKKQLTKAEKRALKREKQREAAERAKQWVEIGEDKNTNVYVSNLPADVTEESFIEFMSKCGLIMKDPRTGKPKIKLYRTETGEPKGDGTCCYIKKESVDLALQILDEWDWNGHKVHVERAKFELKGQFDPTKKKTKLTVAQKKKLQEQQERLFGWKPDKDRGYRPKSDCTVVLKNMFTSDEILANVTKVLDMQQEIKEACERYGAVKKVVVYDSNPEGVVTVRFQTTEQSDLCVASLNGQLIKGRKIQAHLWDGKTRYKMDETEEERQRRLAQWEKYIDGSDNDSDESDDDGGEQSDEMAEKRRKLEKPED